MNDEIIQFGPVQSCVKAILLGFENHSKWSAAHP